MTLRRAQVIVILFSVWILAAILPVARFMPTNADEAKQRLVQSYGLLTAYPEFGRPEG